MNLIAELYRVEYSPTDDNKRYENHSYNGFTGMQDDEAYYKYLDTLFIQYFVEVKKTITKLLVDNRTTLLDYINEVKMSFADIKNNFNEKNYFDWKLYIKNCETNYQDVIKTNKRAKNEYETAKFNLRMCEVQLYFIDKSIQKVNILYDNYNPNKDEQSKIIAEAEISKEKWEQTLSEYKDIIDTFEVAKIFSNKETTIRRWVKEGKLTPIDKTTRPMKFHKSDIKKYYLKL